MIQTNDLATKIQKNVLNIVVLIILFVVAQKIFIAQQKQVEAVKAEIQIELQKNAVLTQIGQSEKRLRNYRRQIANIDDSAFLPAINSIAKDCNVKIIVMNRLPIEDKIAGYNKHSFSLNIAVDNYHSLAKFISALESHALLFTVDNMKIFPDQSGESKHFKLMVTLDVSAILLKD